MGQVVQVEREEFGHRGVKEDNLGKEEVKVLVEQVGKLAMGWNRGESFMHENIGIVPTIAMDLEVSAVTFIM